MKLGNDIEFNRSSSSIDRNSLEFDAEALEIAVPAVRFLSHELSDDASGRRLITPNGRADHPGNVSDGCTFD